jgi:hypothetical protein
LALMISYSAESSQSSRMKPASAVTWPRNSNTCAGAVKMIRFSSVADPLVQWMRERVPLAVDTVPSIAQRIVRRPATRSAPNQVLSVSASSESE